MEQISIYDKVYIPSLDGSLHDVTEMDGKLVVDGMVINRDGFVADAPDVRYAFHADPNIYAQLTAIFGDRFEKPPLTGDALTRSKLVNGNKVVAWVHDDVSGDGDVVLLRSGNGSTLRVLEAVVVNPDSNEQSFKTTTGELFDHAEMAKPNEIVW